MKSLYLIITLTILSISCNKKERTCSCTTPSEKEVVFTTESTRKDAKTDCDKYHADTYGNDPKWSEVTCDID